MKESTEKIMDRSRPEKNDIHTASSKKLHSRQPLDI